MRTPDLWGCCGGGGDVGPGGQGLVIEMDWTEQTWKQPKSPCLARRGQSGEPDVASGLDPQVISPAGVLVSCTSQIN